MRRILVIAWMAAMLVPADSQGELRNGKRKAAVRRVKKLPPGMLLVPTRRNGKRKAAVRRVKKLPPGMVLVPTGWFRMGSEQGDDEKPIHLVFLHAFFIDRHEVTVAAYARCVKAGKCRIPRTGRYYNWGKRGRDLHPVTGVSWFDAKDYCAWSGKRLPTEAEWEKAARGENGRKYPWGNARASCKYAVMRDGGEGCGKSGTWPVGSKPRGVSPYGAHDMAGNVREWVADWYGEKYYSQSPRDNPRGPGGGNRTVYRGGAFYNGGGDLRSADRCSSNPLARFNYVGFRCARSK